MFVFEVDYSHLNAVRARIVELERLAQFRWSSYRAFGRGADERPAWLSCEDWLRTHGELADTPAGWLSYQHRLAWLLADTGRQKEAAFGTMSQGWALGSKDDQREVLAEFHTMEQAKAWGGAEVVEINRILWPERLEAGAKAIGASLLSAAGNINRPKPSDFELPGSRERQRGVIRPLAGARGYRKVQSSKDVGIRWAMQIAATERQQRKNFTSLLQRLGADPVGVAFNRIVTAKRH